MIEIYYKDSVNDYLLYDKSNGTITTESITDIKVPKDFEKVLSIGWFYVGLFE